MIRIKPMLIYAVCYNYREPWEELYSYPIAAYTTLESAEKKCSRMNLLDHGNHLENEFAYYTIEEVRLEC